MAAQQHVHHFRAHTCQELCDTPIADTETSVTTFVDLVALIDRTLDALERARASLTAPPNGDRFPRPMILRAVAAPTPCFVDAMPPSNSASSSRSDGSIIMACSSITSRSFVRPHSAISFSICLGQIVAPAPISIFALGLDLVPDGN